MTMTLQLSSEDRAVLAHVVADVDAYVSHALSTLGQAEGVLAVQAKVARWRDAYVTASALPGYQTKAQTDAADAQAEADRVAARAPLLAAAQAADSDLRTNAQAARTRLEAIINDPTATDTAAKVRSAVVDNSRALLRLLKYLVPEART